MDLIHHIALIRVQVATIGVMQIPFGVRDELACLFLQFSLIAGRQLRRNLRRRRLGRFNSGLLRRSICLWRSVRGRSGCCRRRLGLRLRLRLRLSLSLCLIHRRLGLGHRGSNFRWFGGFDRRDSGLLRWLRSLRDGRQSNGAMPPATCGEQTEAGRDRARGKDGLASVNQGGARRMIRALAGHSLRCLSFPVYLSRANGCPKSL